MDIRQTTYSPGVRRLMARASSQSQFEQASADLLCYAGLKIEPREIERVAEEVGRQVEQWLSPQQGQPPPGEVPPLATPGPRPKFYISFDGTGVPVRKKELVGRRGQAGRRFRPHARSQTGLRFYPGGFG